MNTSTNPLKLSFPTTARLVMLEEKLFQIYYPWQALGKLYTIYDFHIFLTVYTILCFPTFQLEQRTAFTRTMGVNSQNKTEVEPQKNVCWIYRIPLIGALTQGTMLCKCARRISVAHSSLSTVGLQGKPASNATLFMTF